MPVVGRDRELIEEVLVDAETVRLTPQRRAVLDVLAESTDHPTAGEIYDRVRDRVPGIGPATVYRSLALLVESGQAAVLRINEVDAVRYDRTVQRHDHLVCVDCGQVTDAQIPLDERALRKVAHNTSFAVFGYDVQVHGRCARCAAARNTQED